MEHRDSPGIESEQAGEFQSPTIRGFARLVESPAARRIALPRILGASAILFSLLILIGLGVSKLIVRYVSSQSEYQLPFSEIELVPEPEAWLYDGKSRILQQVRVESNRGETLSLLDLDVKALETDFRRCPWVKDVIRIERLFHRLRIHLIYRKPVAVVVLGKNKLIAYPIDEETVYLPDFAVDWTSKETPIHVRGLAQPLIEIRGIESSKPPKIGRPWKRSDAGESLDEPDPMVLRAARLAEFLHRQERTTQSGRAAPNFVSIRIPDEPGHSFFLEDKEMNRLEWGKAPGDEKLGEPSSEARWKMLLEWLDRNGPLIPKKPSYLTFTRTKAIVCEPKSKK